MSIDSMNSASLMMNLIAKKQKAIGENLANIDTPGYVRKDVEFNKYLGDSAGSLETKLSEKFGTSPVFEEKSNESVTPANELMELQKNALLYTMATRQMSSVITQMKTAINVGK
jgi:flagellar basal-body rod protein FlgB